MSLVEHARRELDLCGQTAEDPAYSASLLAALASYDGHSGGSMGCAIDQTPRLLRFESLSPLTSAPGEWNLVAYGTTTTPPVWQSCRNSEAFSNDSGKTYYLLSDRG